MALTRLVHAPWRYLRRTPIRCLVAMLPIIGSVTLGIILFGFAGSIDSVYPLRFESLARAISIIKWQPSGPRATGMQSLSNSDVATLKEKLDTTLTADVIPIAQGRAVMNYHGAKLNGLVTGSSHGYLNFRNTQLIAGRMFDSEENDRGSRVAVIIPMVANALFRGNQAAAIGSDIMIGRVSFRVVGIVGPDATGLPNSQAIIPLAAARDDLFGGPNTVGQIAVLATSAAAVPQLCTQIMQILSEKHTPKKGALQQDFALVPNQAPNLAVGAKLLTVIFWLLVSVAIMALVFGVVRLSVMILKAVDDSTSEIEDFLSMRVRRGVIYRQVLLESVAVSAQSGLIGVTLSVGLVELGQRILPEVAPQYGSPQMSGWAGAGAFGLSLLVGVIAGLIPAKRAARTRLQRITVRYGCCPLFGRIRHESVQARANPVVASTVVGADRGLRWDVEMLGRQKVRAG